MNATYRGPLKLAVLDFAGTTVDYGSSAPAAVFIEGYRRKDIEIAIQQAREPMGMEKRAHIQTIGRMESVAAQWQQRYGRPMNSADVDEMYHDFVPLLLDVLADYSAPIPGAVETANAMRAMGMKIAGTTGYFDEALDVVCRVAAAYGYTPDFSICATQVPAGRPAPWMIFRSMEALDIYPPAAVVKIGDTRLDVEAGLNAGVWTIAVARTGNELGLTEAEIDALPPDELNEMLQIAYTRLHGAGAHYVVDGIADVLPILAEINERLAQGEHP
jgi:phosphonoacetaldehyde hydrolase